jgi:hypothetical protein
MSISIMEAMRLAAPNCVALMLVRERMAATPKGTEEYARLQEDERRLAFEIVDYLLKIDWRGSLEKLTRVIAETRKKNGEDSAQEGR